MALSLLAYLKQLKSSILSKAFKGKTETWKKANVNNFYIQYLKILNTVAKELNTNISTIECYCLLKQRNL